MRFASSISTSERNGSASYSAPPRHWTSGRTDPASCRLVFPEVVMSAEETNRHANRSTSHVSAEIQDVDRSRTSMNAPYSQKGSHSTFGTLCTFRLNQGVRFLGPHAGRSKTDDRHVRRCRKEATHLFGKILGDCVGCRRATRMSVVERQVVW